MNKFFAGLCAIAVAALPVVASADTSVNGQGTLYSGRTFAVNATIYADGTASGQATLVNRTFSGDSGKGPFRDKITITCGYRSGNTVVLGGFSSSNDSNLSGETVFFTIQDNGNPGKNTDIASGANYWDGNPNTQGLADATTCGNTSPSAFPAQTLLHGNFHIRDTK